MESKAVDPTCRGEEVPPEKGTLKSAIRISRVVVLRVFSWEVSNSVAPECLDVACNVMTDISGEQEFPWRSMAFARPPIVDTTKVGECLRPESVRHARVL